MNLKKPKYGDLHQGLGGGTPVLKALWDKFDLSILLTQSGIMKRSGIPSWIIAFAYVVGLIANLNSVLRIAEYATTDKLLQPMFQNLKLAQYTFSRFFTSDYDWNLFSFKRVERLQQEPDTALTDGDVIVLDDTKVAHPHGKKIPFLCWLFDSSDKINVWCMNIVAITVVLKNGLKLPLFWRIWIKKENKDEQQTKIDLSKQMLLDVRRVYSGALWVAMDRWFLCKDFFNWLTDNQFDWVTKAKRNTALYQKEIETYSGRERYVPVKPSTLIKEVYFKLLMSGSKNEVSAIALPNIYMKMPYTYVNKHGKEVIKQRYTLIAAIAAIRLKEDLDKMKDEFEKSDCEDAAYRGAYLLISNKASDSKGALKAYIHRWSIEVFFRTAKQELGLNSCHSTSQSHHYAHIELLFTAETLLTYARWELNDQGTDECFTHGEMVRKFFKAAYSITKKTQQCFSTLQVHFETEVQQFTRLIDAFWPNDIRLGWFYTSDTQYLGLAA